MDAPAPEPSDFAKLNAVYAAMLASLLLATRDRDRDPIALRELLPMGAATFAIAKAVSREKIGSWIREPLIADEHRVDAPGRERLRRAVGELVTCSRCVGAWSALGVVGLRAASPSAGRLVTAVFATSALNDWAQAGFRLLCAASDSAGDVARERAGRG